jgi:ATP-dependent DNA helicase DinG
LNLTERVTEAFSGPAAAQAVPGFVHRQSQVEMAVRVAETLEWGGLAMLEAGTGVGKSIAYLLPAVLSGRKCVVSTATIALQDQLLHKDIPAVGRMVGVNVDAALLKGRGNYLCLRKWSLSGGEAQGWLQAWVRDTPDGDIGHAPREIPAGLRPKLAGDGLDCLGTQCGSFSQCFYYKARNAARKASIMVLNHHLLLCGLASGDLIPEAGLLVVDEAHQLADAAGECLGVMLSVPMLDPVIDAVIQSGLEPGRKEGLLGAVRSAAAAINVLTGTTADDAEYPLSLMLPELDALMGFCDTLKEGLSGRDDTMGGGQAAAAIGEAARRIAELEGSDWCVFTEEAGRQRVLKGVPLEPGPELSTLVWDVFSSAVLTSATLSVAGDFSYFSRRLGVPSEFYGEVFPSPFSYPDQAMLAIPEALPSRDDHQSLADTAWRIASGLARILGGRTMVLFTSYRNLELTLEASQNDPVAGVRVLAQGQMPRSAILDSFRKDPGAVILGTRSFWEGIDLAGDLLQGLVIDRIPFPSPGHPLMRARIASLEARGESPFMSLMLPIAAIRLRQGAGRLIRSSGDRGVLVLLDEKLIRAGYGKTLLASLPPFRRGSLEEALTFAGEHGGAGGVSGAEANA